MITTIFNLLRRVINSSSDNGKNIALKRKLVIESLENRELLSASPIDPIIQDLNELYNPAVCISYPVVQQEISSSSADSVNGQVSQAPPAPLAETFQLHSNPGANFTIYLDFNGHITTGTAWNENLESFVTPAFSLDTDYANFSDAELEMIQYIWQRVAEDFMPFNVDVTTEEPPLNYLIKDTATSDSDGHWGVRAAIGGTCYDWLNDSAGGIAYLGSFSWETDTPAFVFAETQYNDEKYIAETISHEVGHTLGLSHDGYYSDEYYEEINGWGPIMGAGYYSDVIQWSKGEYEGNTNQEDDLAIITGEITNIYTEWSGGNGFTYRNDDHGGDFQTATAIPTTENSFSISGIIERNTDLDYFMFDITTDSVLNLTITSGTRDANLDILATFYDFNGNVISTFDDPETLHANFENLELTAGIYYLSIDGTGRPYISESKIGYSDYGSLGSYKIEVTTDSESTNIEAPDLSIIDITTTTASLDWNEINNATGYQLQWSTDSNVWDMQAIEQLNATTTEFNVEGLTPGTLYYFRVRTVTDEGYSNWTTVSATTEQIVLDDDDYEENDSFAIVDGVALDSEADHTSYLGLILSEKVINDLKLVDGNDYFKFEINQNGTADSYISITFDNAIGDIDLQLFDANKKFLRSSSTASNLEKISLNELAAGIYYARVFSYRDATNTNYTLSIIPPITEAGPINVLPEAPTELTASQSYNNVTLTWNSISDAVSYNVYQQNGTVWTLAGSTAGTNFTVNNLSDGEYTFAVSAVSNVGESEKNFVTINVVNETIVDEPTNVIFEGNNSFDTAADLGVITSLTTIDGLELKTGELGDYYKFEINATGDSKSYIRIDFIHANGDLAFQLFDSTRKQLKSSDTTKNVENFNLSKLAAGVYYVRISGYKDAVNTYSLTINPPIASVVTPQLPATPNGLTATKNENIVTLNWNAVTGATSYNVYQQNGTAWSLVGTVTGTSYSISNLADGTYNFAVSAVSSNGESEKSATSITLISPPAAPSNLSTSQTENGQVTLTWSTVTGATSYNVYQQNGTAWSLVGTVTGTSYSISNLADGTYNFAVSAVSSNGESGKSATSITLVSPPAAPSNLSTSQTENGQVTLTWSTVTGATSYNVYYQEGQNLTLVGTVTSTSFIFNDLDDGLHSFAVSAVSSNGESEKNIVTINVTNKPAADNQTNNNYENNNSFDTAADLGAITSLTTIEGLQLATGEISDYFKFTITATGDSKSYIRIDFIHANGDLAFQLFDSTRKQLKSSDTTKNVENFNLSKLAAGTYYVRISGYKNATNDYSLTVNPPAASVTSAPVTLSAAASISTESAPALTGNYQIYANNSAVILENSLQSNSSYTNLSNQFFATPPSEILANAPVIEIIGHETSDDGKVKLMLSVKNDAESTPATFTSEYITAETGTFQISATFNYYSCGKLMTGVVKSNVYSLLNIL
ncbi:MAG: fibronectin type III domain-containing protein [Planctomycetaceae bacterium]|jgi:hypothetical protein|nr:fibronectin type III domain-containing protein [Planctomycetaceae bacterium]